MKRKIIKQGHNTLTMTLPADWVKQFSLEAGNEVEVVEQENGLFVSAENHESIKSTEIDISNLDMPCIWKMLMSVYRRGYDEVKIKFNSSTNYSNPFKFFTRHAIDLKYNEDKLTPLEMINLITTRFIGFEVIANHKDYCVIQDMEETSAKSFDSSLRRIFLLIQQMGGELLEALRKDDVSFVLHTHDVDINVDKFHDHCIRIMNKNKIKDRTETSITFAILFSLEMLADEFKHIAHHLSKEFENKSTKNLLELAELTMSQVSKFYDFYYNFSKEKLCALSRADIDVHSYLPKLYKKKAGRTILSDSELEIFNHLRIISKYVNALVELRVDMEV